MPYIHHEIEEEKMEEFLEHVEQCEDCREELEIYYTVEAGIRQLDEDTDDYNIKGDMENDQQASRQLIYTRRLLSIARYASDTLIVLCVFVMLLFQLRIWWQTGIL